LATRLDERVREIADKRVHSACVARPAVRQQSGDRGEKGKSISENRASVPGVG